MPKFGSAANNDALVAMHVRGIERPHALSPAGGWCRVEARACVRVWGCEGVWRGGGARAACV